MNKGAFFQQLLFLSLGVTGLLALSLLIKPLRIYIDLSFICLSFFIFYSLGMYFSGMRAIRNKNKNLYSAVVIFFIFGKLALSVLLLLIYNEFKQPTDRFFLVPFFIVYLSFTIFETYFMMKVGKEDIHAGKQER